MPRNAWGKRFRSYSVPVCVFALVAGSVLLVPPLILGELTAETYALTAAVLILAITSVIPYAVIVGNITLPLLLAGFGSYAAPTVVPATPNSLTKTAALRHVIAGSSYVIGAAAVGTIGLGVDLATSSGSSSLPTALGPPFQVVGGGIVGGVFVSLQLWRYDTPVATLDRRIILGTLVLGALLALSPVVAHWVFHSFPT